MSAPGGRDGAMPAITLHQPWASWIAGGLKTIETRTHTQFSGLAGRRIAIHAGKRFDRRAVGLLASAIGPGNLTPEFRTGLRWGRSQGAYPAGAIVCTAEVAEARWLAPGDSAAALCPCDETLFGLVLAEVRTLIPVLPWRGGRGIWYVPLVSLVEACHAAWDVPCFCGRHHFAAGDALPCKGILR